MKQNNNLINISKNIAEKYNFEQSIYVKSNNIEIIDVKNFKNNKEIKNFIQANSYLLENDKNYFNNNIINKDENFLLLCLKQNRNICNHFNDEHFSKKIINYLLVKSYLPFNHIPDKYHSAINFYKALNNNNYFFLNGFRPTNLSYKLCFDYIKKFPERYFDIPYQYFSIEIAEYLIKKYNINLDSIFKYINFEYKAINKQYIINFIIKCLDKNKDIFFYIPDEFMTLEVCLKALEGQNNYFNLSHIKGDVKVILNNNLDVIYQKYVKIKNAKEYNDMLPLIYVPTEYRTHPIYIQSLIDNMMWSYNVLVDSIEKMPYELFEIIYKRLNELSNEDVEYFYKLLNAKIKYDNQ